MRNLRKANRVVKWHGVNETISHRFKSKSDSSLGLRILGPEKGGKQGELAGTCTCLKCILKGWLVLWPTREVMTRSHTLSVVWDLGLANPSVASCTLISKPFCQGLVVVTKARDRKRSHVK